MTDEELLNLCEHVIFEHESAQARGVFHPNHSREWILARALKSRLRDGWVSVAERMPKESTADKRNLVLIWFNGSDGWRVQIGEISVGHWRPEGGNGNFDHRVSHWMKLPEPPKD